ncbi:flippase [Thermodesulfobacteriota bacterium]
MQNRMSTPLRIFKNFSVRFVGRILSIIISIVVMAMVGRYLREAGYGEYAFWYNLIFVLQMFSDVGLQVIIVREIAKCREKVSSFFGDAIFLKGLLSALFIVVTLLVGYLIIPEPSMPFLIIIVLAAVIQPSQDISTWIFRGIEAMEYEAILTVFSQTVWIGCIYLFISRDLGIAHLLAAQLVANLLRTILGFAILLAKGIKPSFRINWTHYKGLLITSLPLGIAFITSMTYNYVNIALLKWFAQPEDIASFNIGLAVTSGFLFIAVTLTTSFFPVFSRYVHEKDGRLPSFYAQVSKYLAIIAAPISVGLIFLADKIIALAFHHGFSDSIVCLQVLSVTLIFRFFNRMYHFVFPASDHQTRYLKHQLAGIVANVILSFILIPRYQYLGACMAFIAGEMVLFLLNYLVMSRIIAPLPFFTVFIKPLSASLAMGAVLFFFQGMNFVPLFTVALLVYPISLLVVRAFTFEEIKFIREILRFRKATTMVKGDIESHE